MLPYVGRFAPTPTGPLHFGSLLAAVASYCAAKQASGLWLVRMEDIDPPREMPGAASTILRQLERYGLHWDGPVLYQSQRSDAYIAAIDQLHSQGLLFWCSCSRSALACHRIYPGTCRQHTRPEPDSAIRLRVSPGIIPFDDQIFGEQREDVAATVGDFVIRRRDGLFAYQLAVVVDDAMQGITHVVRGADLLDNTARQIYLQRLLGHAAPAYAHIPLAVNAAGEKLSKQNFARALAEDHPEPVLWEALKALGQNPAQAMSRAPVKEQLAWATTNWNMASIPHRMLLEPDSRFCDQPVGQA